jgi:hypothetical protein
MPKARVKESMGVLTPKGDDSEIEVELFRVGSDINIDSPPALRDMVSSALIVTGSAIPAHCAQPTTSAHDKAVPDWDW